MLQRAFVSFSRFAFFSLFLSLRSFSFTSLNLILLHECRFDSFDWFVLKPHFVNLSLDSIHSNRIIIIIKVCSLLRSMTALIIGIHTVHSMARVYESRCTQSRSLTNKLMLVCLFWLYVCTEYYIFRLLLLDSSVVCCCCC